MIQLANLLSTGTADAPRATGFPLATTSDFALALAGLAVPAGEGTAIAWSPGSALAVPPDAPAMRQNLAATGRTLPVGDAPHGDIALPLDLIAAPVPEGLVAATAIRVTPADTVIDSATAAAPLPPLPAPHDLPRDPVSQTSDAGRVVPALPGKRRHATVDVPLPPMSLPSVIQPDAPIEPPSPIAVTKPTEPSLAPPFGATPQTDRPAAVAANVHIPAESAPIATKPAIPRAEDEVRAPGASPPPHIHATIAPEQAGYHPPSAPIALPPSAPIALPPVAPGDLAETILADLPVSLRPTATPRADASPLAISDAGKPVMPAVSVAFVPRVSPVKGEPQPMDVGDGAPQITQIAAQSVPATPQPAAQAFAAAIFEAAGAQTRTPRDDRSDTASGASALAGIANAAQQPTIDVRPAATLADTPLDLTRQDWMSAMIERIETLQGDGGVREARIRLTPDALGTLDLTIAQDDAGQLQVHIAADTPQARALLADAAPRLADMAEARGLKLAQAGVEAGAGQQQQSARHDARQLDAPRPARAALSTPVDADDAAGPDARIA